MGLALVSRLTTYILGTSQELIEEYGFDAPKFSHIPQAYYTAGLIWLVSVAIQRLPRIQSAMSSTGLST